MLTMKGKERVSDYDTGSSFPETTSSLKALRSVVYQFDAETTTSVKVAIGRSSLFTRVVSAPARAQFRAGRSYYLLTWYTTGY